MGRHLAVCKVKQQEESEKTAKGKKTYPIYHLKTWGYKPFWLHIEMESGAMLLSLNHFLRAIWLECCGHLSKFTINGTSYSTSSMGDDWWGMESETMNIPLEKVLDVKDSFEYEYDFGTTTRLQGQVFAEREEGRKENITILARNTRPRFPCQMRGAEVTEIDVENETFYCSKCLTAEFGEEYDMVLPVVNSPRMNECGYTSNVGFDDFCSEITLES